MNYKMSLFTLLASSLITLNTWAGCCFVEPAINLPPPTYPCINTPDAATCAGQLPGIAYVNDHASCINLVTCCIQGETAIEFQEKGTIVPVDDPNCGGAIKLPIIIDGFTATLESDGEVSLNGSVTNIGEKAHLNIWRAQIVEGNITKPKKINKRPIPIEGDPNELVDFSEVDINPPSGVNYYVLTDREMNGKLTLHCDHISYVVVGEGTPNQDLAKELCEGMAWSVLVHVFEP